MSNAKNNTNRKTLKAEQDKLDAELRKAKKERKLLEAEVRPDTGGKPSWRDHYKPHPAALVFHQHTTDEDRKKMSDDLKENQRLQAPIVTAHVADESGGETYVVDGITRLDEMEKLGWQIVDEHGNWIGQIEGMFDYRRNYTHEQVRQLVISLNATRRHQTKQQIVESIDAVLKLEEASKGILDNRLSEIQPRKAGRPKDQHKAELTKRAAAAGISEHTVKKALQPDRPKITKPPQPSKPKGNGEDVQPGGPVQKSVSKLLKRLLNQFPDKYEEFVKCEVIIQLLELMDSAGKLYSLWQSPTMTQRRPLT